MADQVTLSLQVVEPKHSNVYNVQFSALTDDEGLVTAIQITTDGPGAEDEAGQAIRDVIEFTESLLAGVREGEAALSGGTATEVYDSRNDKN